MIDRRHTFAALVLCLLVAPFAAGLTQSEAPEPEPPDTPAGRTLAAFLRAVNTGDLAAIRRFHAENDPKADGADDMSSKDLELFGMTGGLRVQSVVRSTDHEIEVLARSKRDGAPVRLEMAVAPSPPHAIVNLRVGPGDAPGGDAPSIPPAKTMTEAEVAEAVQKFLDERAARDEFSGAVLVARNGKPVFEKAYGLADSARNVPNRVDTKFNLGSMNKMFTAVAIAQLAERGKLSFDDTVGKHLPDYPNRDVAAKVTIHHLLTHTSGLGSYWNARFDAKRTSVRTVADYLSLFADEPLLFEPGARFEYSNAGFIVLGAIVEKVSGQSYYDYVREHVYKPAGMTSTDAYAIDEKVPNLAIGYTAEGASPGALRENTSFLPGRGGPAGGGYSTVGDLLKFARALGEHRLLGAKYTEIVTSGKGKNPADSYGYGFGNRLVGGKRFFGHNGGAPGVASDLMIFPESGYTVAVMTNRDPRGAMPVARALAQLIADR